MRDQALSPFAASQDPNRRTLHRSATNISGCSRSSSVSRLDSSCRCDPGACFTSAAADTVVHAGPTVDPRAVFVHVDGRVDVLVEVVCEALDVACLDVFDALCIERFIQVRLGVSGFVPQSTGADNGDAEVQVTLVNNLADRSAELMAPVGSWLQAVEAVDIEGNRREPIVGTT